MRTIVVPVSLPFILLTKPIVTQLSTIKAIKLQPYFVVIAISSPWKPAGGPYQIMQNYCRVASESWVNLNAFTNVDTHSNKAVED